MPGTRVTVLGGGNTGFAVAANLALRGHEVLLAEIPSHAAALAPVLPRGVIRLDGVAAAGDARPAAMTTDLGEACAFSDLLLLIVPAYAHRPFARALAPHLMAGQALVLMPGTLGALEMAETLRVEGRDVVREGILLAETDTAPYVCRKVAPDAAHIWGVVASLGVAALPGSATDRVAGLLAPLFTANGREGGRPGVSMYGSVLECGLSAMNPVIHPAGVLMNAGRIERSRGEFYFYDEGVTPAVCAVVEALDRERLAVGAALGYALRPAAEAFAAAGFGPAGDLWATINGSRMLTQLRAPGAVNTRWLTEDVPYGLSSWASLGAALGVQTPVIDALICLANLAAGLPADTRERTVATLGLSGLTAAEMCRAVA